MVMLNARCKRCFKLFPSGMEVQNSRSITITGMTVGPCPYCGGMGNLVLDSRKFDVVGDALTVTSGPPLSAAELANAFTILNPFVSGVRSRKATERAIVSAVPALAPEIEGKRLTLDQLIAIIGLILSLIAVWQTQQQPEGVTQAQMNTLIQEVRSLKDSPGLKNRVPQRPEQKQPAAAQKEPPRQDASVVSPQQTSPATSDQGRPGKSDQER